MNKKVRQIIAIFMFIAGLSLLTIGLTAKTYEVLSKEGDETTITAEKDIVKEVTRHGVDLNDDGKLARTYSTKEGAAPPPDDCPT